MQAAYSKAMHTEKACIAAHEISKQQRNVLTIPDYPQIQASYRVAPYST
jgi:hypothetical protein